MPDYTKGRNLAHDRVTDTIRVFTSYFPARGGGYDSEMWETWIFGEFLSQQYIHRSERDALRRHPMIVRALRSMVKELDAALESVKESSHKRLSDKDLCLLLVNIAEDGFYCKVGGSHPPCSTDDECEFIEVCPVGWCIRELRERVKESSK